MPKRKLQHYLSRNPVAPELKQHNIAEAYINYIFTNAIPPTISKSQLIEATTNDPTLISLKQRFNERTARSEINIRI